MLAAAVVVHLVVLYVPLQGPGGGLPLVDKVVHVLVFGAVAFCGRRSGVPSVLLVAVLALHAGISELVHGSVPALDREGDPLDVVADLVGIALGYFAARRGSSVAGGRSGETMKAWTRS